VSSPEPATTLVIAPAAAAVKVATTPPVEADASKLVIEEGTEPNVSLPLPATVTAVASVPPKVMLLVPVEVMFTVSKLPKVTGTAVVAPTVDRVKLAASVVPDVSATSVVNAVETVPDLTPVIEKFLAPVAKPVIVVGRSPLTLYEVAPVIPVAAKARAAVVELVKLTASTAETLPVVKPPKLVFNVTFNVSLPAPPLILSVAFNVNLVDTASVRAVKMSSAEPPTKLSVVAVVNATEVEVASATEAATSAFQAVAIAP